MSFHRGTQLNNILLLLIVLLVCGVYFPAFNGAIISIDDVQILARYADNPSLKYMFSPGEGYYFRPIIELSYYVDSFLWLQNPFIIHTENIIIHVINAWLIFLIASRLAPENILFAFLSAVVFAVHPINSEAICWLAGRTDPMAMMFILLGVHSLLKGVKRNETLHYWCAVGFGCCALLTKETAVIFLPVACLMLWWFNADIKVQKISWLVTGGVCVGILLFFFLFKQHGAIAELFLNEDKNLMDMVLKGLSITGYYLKKVIVPFPLNFAVTKVPQSFALITGVVVLLIVMIRRDCWYLFLVSGLLFLLPSVVAGMFNVAWTIVADRYLYIPMGFFSIGMIGILGQARVTIRHPYLICNIGCFIVVAAASATFQRSKVWQSNVTLFQDTVNKSPDFALARNQLALALIKDGRYSDAKVQLGLASSMNMSSAVRQLVTKNKLLLMLVDGSLPEDSRQILLSEVGKNFHNYETEVLNVLRNIDYRLYMKTSDLICKQEIVNEIVMISDVIYKRTKDPILPYNNGQLLLSLDKNNAALEYFQVVADTAPDDSIYKEPSKKLVQRLK